VCSCVLSKVNAQEYQMEVLNPDKTSYVKFYNPNSKRTVYLTNVDSLKVASPQPSDYITTGYIEVRLKNNDDLKLFVYQSYFPKEKQEFFKELRNIELAKQKAKQEKEISERRNKLTIKYGKEVADKIIDRQVWVGMTEEMLIESRGKPYKFKETITNKVISKKYIYEYATYSCGGYIYESVHLENGKCINILKGY
jgi:hypothetical protein